MERENLRGQKRITDPVLLKKIVMFLADNMEVDFIANKPNDKIYIQVAESMVEESVRKRELSPLQKISDNYEKKVLSLNTGMDSSYDGIKSIHVIDWLLEE